MKNFDQHEFKAKGTSGQVHLARKLSSRLAPGWKLGTACGCLIPHDGEQPFGVGVTCEDCLKELTPAQLRRMYQDEAACSARERQALIADVDAASAALLQARSADLGTGALSCIGEAHNHLLTAKQRLAGRID